MFCEATSSPCDDTSFIDVEWEHGTSCKRADGETFIDPDIRRDECIYDVSANADSIDPSLLSCPQTPEDSWASTSTINIPTTQFQRGFLEDTSSAWLAGDAEPNAVDCTPDVSSSLYPDFGLISEASELPYFNSVETAGINASLAHAAHHHISSAGQMHRRSISEPPDGFANHQQALPGYARLAPHITFHRAGHFLGIPRDLQPQHDFATPLKSQPKAKSEKQERSRRSQALNSRRRAAPTSAPRLERSPYSQPARVNESVEHHLQLDDQVLSTPSLTSSLQNGTAAKTTEAPTVSASPNTNGPAEEKVGVSVLLSVEELRNMIADVVEQAIGSIETIEIKGGERRALTIAKRKISGCDDSTIGSPANKRNC